jgi:hypothetical protein
MGSTWENIKSQKNEQKLCVAIQLKLKQRRHS